MICLLDPYELLPVAGGLGLGASNGVGGGGGGASVGGNSSLGASSHHAAAAAHHHNQAVAAASAAALPRSHQHASEHHPMSLKQEYEVSAPLNVGYSMFIYRSVSERW